MVFSCDDDGGLQVSQTHDVIPKVLVVRSRYCGCPKLWGVTDDEMRYVLLLANSHLAATDTLATH